MSVPARSQEDPYAFTETTSLPANTSLIRQQQQQQPTTVSAAASSPIMAAPTPTTVPIKAGTSLLANNNNANSGNPVAARLNHVVQQRTLLGTGASKLAPIKVTLVQSPSGGILGKARLNGTTITSSPQGTVFRTVTVPQATTIVQRSIAPSSSGANATPTVFTKPLQVQISPQQAAAVAAAGGKFTARRILASKSPNVSPVMATAVSGSTHPTGIQTVRIVKTSPANVLQTVGAGRTTAISADGTRRFISHSGAASLLGSPVVVTTSVAPGTATSQQQPQQQQQQQQQSSPQQLPTISPTKIRLIQPQPQGKIFLHTPNSSNSLAAATHISNPISIAALRNSLAKQNPSLLNKIVVQQQHQQSPQQVQIAVSAGSPSTSNGLPTVRMIPTSSAVSAINIQRAVSAASVTTTSTAAAAQPKRQMSLETGTTTVMVPTMAKPATSASTSPAPVVVKQVKVIPAASPQQASPTTGRPQTIQIPQTLLQQRAKTPTQSILKPQPPRPQPAQPTAVVATKTPQKLVIAAPKTPQQQQPQQLHSQQVMVLASPKSLGAGGQQQQQQVMVVTAPKGLGGHQQHQVVVLAPFKPGQLTAVNRQPQQLVATSLMKQIQQQQQQQQILTSPVIKTIQKVQPQPQQVIASPKQIQQPQVLTTSPVVKQVVQNQAVAKPPQQPQQVQHVLATSVAKTIQQRQFVATSVAKPIQQQQQQQQVVVTSVAKPTQQPQPQQIVATSIVKPVQQPQPQQVLINAAPKPPALQQQQQQQQPPPQQQPPQQFVVVPPPKPVPQLPPTTPQQQQPTPTPIPVAVAPTPPPPIQTPPVSQPQDDFTIPSFIIPKQKEAKKVVPEKQVVTQQQPVKLQTSVPVTKPASVAVTQPPPPPPSPVLVAPQVTQAPPAVVVPPSPIIPEPQLPSTSMVSATPKSKAPKESGGKSMVPKRAAKRSYSRSSHNETLERIEEPAAAPPIPKIHKWSPPRAVSVPVNREWHAPDSWIFDICPPGTRSYEELENAPLTMDCWFEEMYTSSEFDTDLIGPRKIGGRKGERLVLPRDDGELVELSSEERSERRKAMMRRRAVQYWNAQRLRDPEPARKRLKAVERVLKKLEKHRETMLSRNGGTDLPKCQRAGCERDALLATNHCREHIADNTEQRLFQRCTAKFSDNSQCQVPVFDIRQELVLCREHAWKHDNHDKKSAEVRLLKKPAVPAAIVVPTVSPASLALKKKPLKMPLVKVVQPVHHAVTPAANKNSKVSKKKKKLTPFQQQMALHQQQYKQQYAVKPTLPPPPYPAQQQQVAKQQPSLYRQQSQPKYQQPVPVQIVPPMPVPPHANRNLQIPLNQQQTMIGGGHHQQQIISRNEDLMLNYQGQSQLQYSHQQVQQILAAAAAGGGITAAGGATQDLLNICENSSAYASSEDTGVGGLSESELMAAQDVIEEIPFEIGNLNNVLSQLPPDAFNELLFSEQEQNGPPFESTREEEEDLERALEAVGEHVKSLEDMTVESANLFGDFLDNVDDEMLDGPDMCAAAEQMLVVQSPGGPNDIRGLVHT